MTNKGIFKLNKEEILHLVLAFDDYYRDRRTAIIRTENKENREYFKRVVEKLTPLFEKVKVDSYGVPQVPDEIIMIFN